MQRFNSLVRICPRLRNDAVAQRTINVARAASTWTSQPGSRQRAAYLAVGALFGGMATVFAIAPGEKPPLSATTEPRWLRRQPDSAPTRSRYADRQTMLKAVDEIRNAVGEEAVSIDEDDLEEHGHSDWSTSNTDVRPIAIVRPASTQQVSAIAAVCSRYRVPMIPYGAGSSVEGNFSSPFSGICIDLSAMNSIVAFHPEDMDVVVQPGVSWVTLNEDIKDSKLFLPLDPGPTALIGGMVATNCSGTNALRYGTMKDYC
ncbi:hypothetical protein HIM_02437 [Hirsutella minnesotensis 3608]|nr:hypothetical protein HIM_02437 [Hirsutella minnesotensis 3608]